MTEAIESVAKIAAIETNITHLTSQMGKMIGYLESGSIRGTEQTAALAVLTDNMKDLKVDFADYRKECSTERDNHTLRLRDVESWQKNQTETAEKDSRRQTRTAALIATIISTLIAGGALFLQWAKK